MKAVCKELPKAIVSEQAVLGAIIRDSEVLCDVVGKVNEESFYHTTHQIIFKAMRELFDRGVLIEIPSLTEQLQQKGVLKKCGGVSYLIDLQQGATFGENIDYHCENIRATYIKREVIKICNKTVDSSYNGEAKAGDIISSLTKEICAINDDSGRMFSFSEIMESCLGEIDLRYQKKDDVVGNRTGIATLDDAIGGLKKGELIIVAGRPSMGKTAFALNIASNVAKTKKVAIFSFEMTKEELGDRFLAEEGSVKLKNIKTGNLNDSEFDRVTEASNRLSIKLGTVYDGGAITVSEIKAMALKLKAKEGLDLIIIDYLQLIEGDSKSDGNRVYEISKISRELKSMAKDLGVTVIALSQLSRGTESRNDRRPILSDLRDSGSIEQDADIIIMLYRESYYNRNVTEQNICEAIVGKNRNGQVGVIKLRWLPEVQKFREINYR